MTKKIIAVLMLLCLTVGILAGCNRREIDKNTHDEFLEVLPEAKNFSKMDVSNENIPSTVEEAYYDTNGAGFVIKVVTSGYNYGLTIIVGIDNNGVITGAKCTESNETWGYEESLGKQFIGRDINTYVDVQAGATSLTVNGYRNGIGDALEAYEALKNNVETEHDHGNIGDVGDIFDNIFGGDSEYGDFEEIEGEVNDRTPEQILQDNLNEALPSAEGEFTKVNVIDNNGKIYTYADLAVDAIYNANNGTGSVYVIGKRFIAVDATGILGEATDEEKAAVESAKAIINSALIAEDVDITELKAIKIDKEADAETKALQRKIMTAFKNINSVKKTEAGVYIVELSIQGYFGAPTPMSIIVTVGADGAIVDFAVTDHSESGSYGGEKIEGGYYDEYFIGKNQTECEGVDFANGSTETSNGIKKAINYSFVAVYAIENYFY